MPSRSRQLCRSVSGDADQQDGQPYTYPWTRYTQEVMDMTVDPSPRHARLDPSDEQSTPTASKRVMGNTGTRQRSASTLTWTVTFTVVQAWAVIVVLTQLRADGVTKAALALVLSGTVIAIISAWQEVRPRPPGDGSVPRQRTKED